MKAPGSLRCCGFGLRKLALAGFLVLGAFGSALAAFVYELPNEFFTSGDFNGDGIPDVLVLDKFTGNARVGYGDGNGNLTWSAPLVTGIENVTGVGVEHFLATNRDSVAVTTPGANLVNLVDVSQTNSATAPQTFSQNGIGPHAVAGLHAPRAPISPGLPFLIVASSYNDFSAELLDLGEPGTDYGLSPESGPFDLANGLDINSNLPTLAVGMVRGATNDTLHLWEFDNSPGVVGVFSNLPPGSDYVFGWFNGEALPRFIFYTPGGSNLTIVPLLQTNSGYAFGASLLVAASEAVQKVYYIANGTNGSALVQFGDGVQGLTLPNGSAAWSSNYQAGAGAAGNAFTGIVPLGNGQLALFDAPPSARSAHAQVLQFNGSNFVQLSASNLPSNSSRSTRSDVWLFQLEPFVNRSPGLVASLNSPDWADSVGGLPGAVQVTTELDSGTTNGLGNLSTNSLGAAPSGSAFGIGNQYNPAISVFSYSAPRAPQPISVTISPPPGSYGSPLAISLNATPSGSGALYRVGDADSWHSYTAQFLITNDATIEFFGTNALGARAGLQFAAYSLGNPPTTGSNSPIVTNPGSTNTVAILSTNQLTLSLDGTTFYGRRSVANSGTIWSINLDGSSDTYITTGARPRVSSDGRWLAFLREGDPFDNQGNLWVRDLQSGNEGRLFVNSDYLTGFWWETNDSALLMDYSCGIWDLNTNGALASLISADCFDDAPSRNPANGSIAFHNLNPNSAVAGIYVAQSDGSGRQRIISTVPGASWPAWSSDGQTLVFADGNNTNANSGDNLWVANSDGSDLIQISGLTGASNGFPHGALWTPDDDALVAAGNVFGTNGLWLIPLAAGRDACDGPPILLPTTPGDAIDFAGSISSATPFNPIAGEPLPGLFILQTPDVVLVYWSTNFAGYSLESTSNLLTKTWTPVSGPYYLGNGYFEYWELRANLQAVKFFRLRYTGAMVLTQPPALTIQLQTNLAVVSWPDSFVGFTLQARNDLSPATRWSDLAGPYAANEGNFQFSEPLNAAGQRFYRLRGP